MAPRFHFFFFFSDKANKKSYFLTNALVRCPIAQRIHVVASRDLRSQKSFSANNKVNKYVGRRYFIFSAIANLGVGSTMFGQSKCLLGSGSSTRKLSPERMWLATLEESNRANNKNRVPSSWKQITTATQEEKWN